MKLISRNIQSLRSTWKSRILKVAAFVLFHSPIRNLINRYVNSFQFYKNHRDKPVFPLLKKRRCKNVQILLYHRVNDDRDPFFPAMPINVFASQMEYLASHFSVSSLEDIVERLKHNDVADNTVAITFDDGYRDNYTNAFPILRNLSIPATIFLATDPIETKRVLWHDRVFSSFRETRMASLNGFGHNSENYPLCTVQEKIFAQAEVLRFLRSVNGHDRSFWVARLTEKLGVPSPNDSQELMLSWDEVKFMSYAKVDFGSHSVSHPILSKIQNDKAIYEIYESKMVIEKRLNISVKAFAYPNGKEDDYNEFIKDILREAGYSCALTTIFGTNEAGQDLFELRRVIPWNEDLATFAMRLNYYKFCS